MYRGECPIGDDTSGLARLGRRGGQMRVVERGQLGSEQKKRREEERRERESREQREKRAEKIAERERAERKREQRREIEIEDRMGYHET